MVKSIDDYSNEVYELAQFMHDNYIAIAVDPEILGKNKWVVQEGTDVLFEELPAENMVVMLELASRVMGYMNDNDLETQG